jgi:hypothetical protein
MRIHTTPYDTFPDLDILPEDLPRLKDPTVEVWFVEGHKKADALRSQGILAISITGTFMYLNGRVIVPALDEVPLAGRRVVAGYDSDAAVKEGVAEAELRIAEAVRRRDAKVHVLRLPAGPDGKKWGVDDALVAGWSIADLRVRIRRWDRTGPGLRIRDPYAGQDKDAVITELRAANTALVQAIKNPELTRNTPRHDRLDPWVPWAVAERDGRSRLSSGRKPAGAATAAPRRGPAGTVAAGAGRAQ